MRFALILPLLLAATAADAVVPKDFLPSRGLAMGGARSAASGNEAIFLNPAALAATRRYTVQLDYAHSTDKSSSSGNGDALVLSIVDSLSNPQFPTGLAYRYASVGNDATGAKGNTKDIAVAFPIGQAVLLGLHVTHLSYTSGGREFSQFTGDLGLVLDLSFIKVSAVGFNLIQVDTPDVARGASTGVSLTDEYSYRISGDVRWEFLEPTVRSYSAGAEYLLGGSFPVRVGYDWDKVRGAEYASGGVGLVTQSFGADVSYRRDVKTKDSIWVFAIKLFGN